MNIDSVDVDDRNRIECFKLNILDRSPEYEWLEIKLIFKDSELYGHDNCEASFILFYDKKNKSKSSGISCLYLDGDNVDKLKGFKSLSDFEALLLNLYYNKTPIDIDITDEDDFDTSVSSEEDY